MSEVTHILKAIDAGDAHAAEKLLPLVYDELRRLAAAKMSQERPGQTLDATALVHEAYLRLVKSSDAGGQGRAFSSRGHFFAAAAEAMRRILVDRARQRKSLKRGGGRRPLSLEPFDIHIDETPEDFLALHEALGQLEQHDRRKAELIKLRFFAGLTIEQAAQTLGISGSTANNDWVYARAWLRRKIDNS